MKIDPQNFSERDIPPLIDFVNDMVVDADRVELPAELVFGNAQIVLRRYTVDVSPTPRILVLMDSGTD